MEWTTDSLLIPREEGLRYREGSRLREACPAPVLLLGMYRGRHSPGTLNDYWSTQILCYFLPCALNLTLAEQATQPCGCMGRGCSVCLEPPESSADVLGHQAASGEEGHGTLSEQADEQFRRSCHLSLTDYQPLHP